MPRARRWADEQLRAAVNRSENLFQICRVLGIAPGRRTYALLRRHIDRLQLDADHLPQVERPRRKRTWTDDDLRAAVARCTSYSGVMRALGYEPSGGMHRWITAYVRQLGVDTSHFRGHASNEGRRFADGERRRMTLEEILVRDSTYTDNAALRRRLIKAGLKDGRCERRALDSWMGESLPLALDHINGDHTDNRLQNLRILCPNCHALTDTWCSRNRKKKPAYPNR
ncbi:MAG TPA: hypothetical protein VE623_08605 [Acidimicrobiales bacterium]|nr:hypothetical protein [Acidimicrobiales bacterium]